MTVCTLGGLAGQTTTAVRMQCQHLTIKQCPILDTPKDNLPNSEHTGGVTCTAVQSPLHPKLRGFDHQPTSAGAGGNVSSDWTSV